MTDLTKKEDCITLIGMPGCGKSTWVESYEDFFSVELISMDRELTRISRRHGVQMGADVDHPAYFPVLQIPPNLAPSTYQTSFDTYKHLADIAVHAKIVGQRMLSLKGETDKSTVVVDSTNLSRAKRAAIRDMLPSTHWDHYAVFFPCESFEEVLAVNEERQSRNKGILPDVLQDMYNLYLEESADFMTSKEAKGLYKEVWVPSFQAILHHGKVYD